MVSALVAIVGLGACDGCHAAREDHPAAPAAETPPSVRLYLLSDLAGAIEPCGCTKDQLGGLSHFGAWLRQGAGRATELVASAGPLFFMDERLDPERADQDRAKADALARALSDLDWAAMAPGHNDWALGTEGLARLAGNARATVIVPDPNRPPFSDHSIRDAGSGIKVGFVGYGQPESAADESALAVVRRGVDHAKAEGANVLIALAAVGRGEAKRMADAIPELTAVVVGSARTDGDANTEAPPIERVGDVLIIQSANHLQTVAVLDLYVREAPSPGHVIRFADATGIDLASRRRDLARRIDELHVRISAWERDKDANAADVEARRRDLAKLQAELESTEAKPPPKSGSFFRYAMKEVRESLGSDPAVDDLLRSYYRAVDEHNRIEFANRLPPPAAPGEASYVGIETCSNCHAAARRVWDGTAHARAYGTLSSQFKEFNLECVSCHVTGYERPGGSTVTHVEGLRNVQCEVCHGPGSKHAARPQDKALIVATPPLSACLACHEPPHVEGFDAAAKLVAILGPGHGMPETR
jgi:2',3'-cyclic-nucleotide 2'-phosphodiesterase (5'-nucleotidase family)